MKKLLQMKFMLLLCTLIVGSGTMWADPTVLFHETFGNNTGSARDWNDTYSVKSGVSSVYSGITSYTVSNAKQGKNTTGSTQSGLNQSSMGTDAYIIIGPLSVADYESLAVTYQWKAASIKGTYSTKLEYATSSGGSYTEVSGTGDGATSFVERSYSLPAAAQVSTLYLKITWNTSNTQAIIDEVELTGTAVGGGSTTYSVTYDGNGATSGTVPTDATAYESGATVTVLGNTGDLAKTGCAFDGWNTQANGGGTNYDADDTFTISANTTLYAKWTPYTITAQSNNESYGTVTLSGNEITGSPNSGYRYADPAYTVSPENSATVVQDGNTFTVTPTANTTITINFEAIPTHTATFSVNGTTTTTDFQEGAAITFPANPADIEGKSFVGWTGTAISGTTDEKPTFVTSATMGDADIFLYAVFAKVEQGGEDTYEVLSSNIFDVNANYVIAAKQSANDATMWYFYSYGNKVDENASWGKMTTDPSTNAPITFTLSGTASELIVQANTGHYLKGLTNGNFQMSASSQKIALDENGNIKSSNNTGSYALRHNYNNGSGGLRWYNSTTGQPANFYKVIPGTTYSGYCTTVEARADAELSFAQAAQTAEVYFASQYTGQGLTNPHSVSPITWTSSNENVATVNENGTVTVIAVGETTITASFAGNGDYNAGEASYTLTVQDSRADAGISYPKNEETIDLKVGDYDAIYHTSNPLTNPNSLTGFSWTSSNEDVATVNQSGVVTLKAVGETTITASFAGNINYKPGVASFTLQVVDNRQDATVTWKDADGNNITELNVEKGDFIQGITLSCNVEGFTFTEKHLQHLWGTNETHDNYAGQQPAGYIFTPNAVWTAALGITTITATFPGNETHKPASATLTVTVTGGTEKTPYTVAEARAAIDAGTGVTEVYATGIVSEIVTAFNSQYGNITYNISADGLTTSDQLQAYRGKSYNGNNFTSADDIQVGDVVIIYGNLKNHNNIYEFAESNQLYFNQPRLIVANEDKTVTVNAAGTITSHEAQTITINYRNFLETTPSANNVSVLFCDVNGTVAAESYDWIKSIEFKENGNGYFTMDCSFEANNGDEARTGYAKVAVTAENTQVSTTIYYSDIITITQNAPIASHTATFSVNGTATDPVSYEEGETITFPEVSGVNGMTFMGWTTSEIEGTTDEAPTLVSSATMGSSNITYYAVFAVNSGIGSYTLDYSKEENLSSSTDWGTYGKVLNYEAEDGSVWTIKAYKNAGMQINNGKDCSIKVPGCPGYISTIEITCSAAKAVGFSSNNYEGSGNITYVAEGTDATSQTLNLSNSIINTGYIVPKGGSTSITKIIVNYSIYSDYCTTIPTTGTLTLNAACHDNKGKIYGTFYTNRPYIMPATLRGSVVSVDDGKLVVDEVYDGSNSEVVPANTALLISTADNFTGTHDYTITYATGGDDYSESNMLKGTLTADEETEGDGCLFYRLTMHNGETIGFWWGAAEGGKFKPGANKAYLAVPTSVVSARSGFAFDDEATGISQIENGKLKMENYYDLQGRKVSKPGKGLYIVNGKKVVIK